MRNEKPFTRHFDIVGEALRLRHKIYAATGGPQMRALHRCASLLGSMSLEELDRYSAAIDAGLAGH